MRELFSNFFDYFILVYSGAIISSYILMIYLAWRKHIKRTIFHNPQYTISLLKDSPYTPGISIVAPAYNEEKTIITNVLSLLGLDYPNFEVVIVNDGSKDKTLELLIEHFDLVQVPYAYIEKIKTKPFKAVYTTKSDNPMFKRLKVVDKENGGTKADATNAGINVVSNKYFVCTDVDCIIEKYALYRTIWPLMQSQRRVIAVSASMRMSNGCRVKGGRMDKVLPPHDLIPLFQDLEYARSYLVGKSAFAAINGMINVSGGFGLFDTEIAIKAGGYDGDSFAEDMDMIARMIRYMCDSGEDYRIVQIPEICCWTEGPSTLKVLSRQRVRWGRGLFQFFSIHKDMLFKRNYRIYGMVTLPYVFTFELLAPIVEACGYLMILYLILSNTLNWGTMLLAFFSLYCFAQALALVVMSFDMRFKGSFEKKSNYFWFLMASLLEPIIYHPMLVFFSLRGYIKHITGTKMVWGAMTRKGVTQTEGQPVEQQQEQQAQEQNAQEQSAEQGHIAEDEEKKNSAENK